MNKTPFSGYFIGKSALAGFAVLGGVMGTTLYTQNAQAQLTQNITLGNPKALALGHAVTADPPGVDSIHFNPAGLAKIKGRQQNLKLLTAQITFEAEFGPSEIPEDRQIALCQVTEGCDSSNQEDWSQVWPEDPIANTKSKTSDPMLMLPGAGATEVPFLVVPFGGIAVEDPNYGWTMATAAYSPQAIGYKRDENDPAAFQGIHTAISRITYFSPSVGIKFNDELSFGASIGFSWQGLGIKTKFRAPETTLVYLEETAEDLGEFDPNLLRAIGPYDTVGTLTMELEDPLSLSFNLGVLWEPTEWFSMGAVYQSESKSNLEGEYTMEYDGKFGAMAATLTPLNLALNVLTGGRIEGPGEENEEQCLADAVLENYKSCEYTQTGDIEMEFIVPQHFAVGTSIRVFPDLKVNFDVKWTDYAAWESLDFTFDPAVDFLTVASLVYAVGGSVATADGNNADPDEMRIPRHYESTTSWALGMEYQWDNNTVLRFGYEPRGSAVPNTRVDLLAPLAEATLYSLGGGYQLDKFSRVDVAFAYMTSDFDAAAGESQNMNSNEPGRVVYNPYAFTSVKASTTAYLFALSYDTKF